LCLIRSTPLLKITEGEDITYLYIEQDNEKHGKTQISGVSAGGSLYSRYISSRLYTYHNPTLFLQSRSFCTAIPPALTDIQGDQIYPAEQPIGAGDS